MRNQKTSRLPKMRFYFLLFLPCYSFALSPNPFDSDAMLAGVLGTEYIDRQVVSDEENQKIVEACGYSKYYVRAQSEIADVFLIKKSMARKYRVEKSVGQIKRIEQVAFDKKDDALLSLVIDVKEPPMKKVKEVRLVLKNDPLSLSQKPWNTAFRIVAQSVKDNYSFIVLRTKEKLRKEASQYARQYALKNPDKIKSYQKTAREKRNEYFRQYRKRKNLEMTEEQRESRRAYYREMWHKKYKLKNKTRTTGASDSESKKIDLVHDVIFLSREENGGGIDVVDKSETADKQIESDEIYRIIWDAIKTLDPLSHEIANLILSNVKDNNIANALGCQVDQVLDVRFFLMDELKKLGF